MPSTRASIGAVTTTIACVVPVFLVAGLAVQIGAELDFSPAGLGLAVAVYFGGSALTSIPAGALVERYGPTVIARVGIGLAAVTLLGIGGAARDYPALVALLGAAAAANSLGQLAANAMLARVPRHRQGLWFGIKQASIPAATLLAGLSVPAIALTVGWRWAFGIAAGAAALAMALVPPVTRADQPRARRWPARGEQATGALVVVGAGAALGAATAGVLGTFLVDSAVNRGLAPGRAGLLLTLGSVVCVLGRVGYGWLADVRRTRGDLATVAVLLTIGSVGLALLAAPGPVALVVGVLLGFGFGWVFPGLVNLAVVQLHPDSPAAATSITQTGVYLGGCVGPLLFGATAATAGYPVSWLGAAVALLGAAGLMLLGWRLLRDRRRPVTATDLPASVPA